MTRGKHSAQVAERAKNSARVASEALRTAQAEVASRDREIANRDREIDRLRDALANLRTGTTLVGTYTEADVARLNSEWKEQHRAAIRAGFSLVQLDVGLPMGRLSEVAEAFECETSDILTAADSSRLIRRMTAKQTRIYDEAEKRGLLR